MYKKRLIFYLLLLATTASRAQVSMTLQVPPAGVLVKNQLWNMMLVNTGNHTLSVRVSLALLDGKTNQPVLTATSMPIQLSRGARQLQAKDLAPIQYAYGAAAFHADENPNGLLPAGSYQACYTVLNLEKGGLPMAENCIQLNIDPLSPPLLNTPADESKLSNPYPQFTWLPPTPPGLFNDLEYDMILVEVLPGQGKADAVEQNIPVYAAGFTKNLYLNYPSSYRALDTSRLYAWRIVALNNGQATSMSDIWTFRVTPPPKPSLKRQEGAYVELRRGLDPSISSSGQTLKLTYDNQAADTVVRYTVTSLEDPGNPVVQQGQLVLGKGRDFLEVPLGKNAAYSQRKVYLFRLVNGRNESWTLKFTWSPAAVEAHSN